MKSPFITFIALTLALTTVATAESTTLRSLIAKGDIHDKRFEPDSALDYYLKAEKEAPKDASLLVKIARQYIYIMDKTSKKASKKEIAQTALAYSKRAVAEAPTDCHSHLSLAICYGKLTPLVGTRERLAISSKLKSAAENAIQCDPSNDYAWHLLGRWHQALAGVGGVTRSIAKLVYGTIPESSYGKAAECFRKASSLNQNRLIHQIELGRTYAAMGRTTDARTLIKRGLAMPNTEHDDPATKRRGRESLKEL